MDGPAERRAFYHVSIELKGACGMPRAKPHRFNVYEGIGLCRFV